ncbi:hypothetical protein H0O03_01780 [Candidatus Micrarchaeota archaeon]|nr:hypothetical protein [Candidatus Micrarchaeota archaeon]
MNKLAFTAFAFVALIALFGQASAQAYCPPAQPNCCRHLEYSIVPLNASVTQGVEATYDIVIRNTDLYSQTIRASAECNPLLSCSFQDLPFPTTLLAGQSAAFHFTVQTAGADAKSYFIPLELRGGSIEVPCIDNTDAEGNQLGVTLNVAAPAAPTPAPLPITATLSPTEPQTVIPGESAAYTLTIRNDFGRHIYASILTDGTNPFETTTFYSASQISLEAGETKAVDVRVTIPPGTPGATYSWAFLVRGSPGSYSDLAFPVSLQVYAETVALSLLGGPYPTDCVETSAGQQTILEMYLRNDGESNGPFQISLEGTTTALSVASIDQSLLELKKGEQAPITLTIEPNRATVLDTYSATLVVKSGQFEVLRRNICFKATGLESIEVLKPANSVVLRARTTAIPFRVRNTGTVAEDVAFYWDPLQEIGEVLVQPATMKLNPSESAEAQLVITTSMTTPLEDFAVPIQLHAAKSNYTLAVNFNASVYSSNASNESLLSISAPDLTAAQEGIKTVEIRVSNNGAERLEQVRLMIEGIPASWYAVDFPRPIQPNGYADFLVTLAPPANTVGVRPVKLFAWSGREAVKQDAELEVTPYIEGLDAREVARTEKSKGNVVSEVDLTLRVTNNGQNTIENIAPTLLADDVLQYNYDTDPSTVSLEPGASADVKLTLRPNKQTEAKSLPIQLASDAGKAAPNALQVPAMTAAAVAGTQPPWKIITVLALLVVIFAVYAYERREEKK